MTIQNQIKELREQHYSRNDIQEILGCSQHTISSALPEIITPQGEEIIKLRASGLSFSEIKNKTGYSKSTISKWIKLAPKLEKPTKPKSPTISKNPHIISRRISRDSRRKAIYLWFKQLKNKCWICGYNKCHRALDFHHVDNKKFGLSKCYSKSLPSIISEIEKCIILCKNCHIEHHYGMLDISHLKTFNNIIPTNDVKNAFNNIHYVDLTDDVLQFEREWINNRLIVRPSLEERSRIDIDFKKLYVAKILKDTAADLFNRFHYLGMSGKGGWYYGLMHDNTLIGAAIITNAVRQGSDNCEISRFVLSVECKNLASKFLSLIINKLLRDTKFKAVQAYADTSIHSGSIYKAANFKFIGTSDETYSYNGIHKKTIYERAKSLGLTEHEYASIFNLSTVNESGKHKFVYHINS